MHILPHTIRQSAARFPEQEAFRCGKQSYTYASLVQQSNQLAHQLIELGVQRGDRIGIYMNRCLETALAVYGTMSAGAAFVPLDPHAPAARNQFVIKDCGIKILLTTAQQKRTLKAVLADENLPLQHIIGTQLDENINTVDWATISTFPDTVPDVRILENDLAYIMYTSGTTGTPKGIMHTHYSGLSYAKLSAELYDVQHTDRLGNHAALHFDISTMGYFTMPFAGGTTVIIPDMHTKLPASMAQLIEQEQLTIWYSVPLALIQLLQPGILEERNLNSIRWVLYGGEPFPAKHLSAIMQHCPQATFCNVYGPAEVNQCTYYNLPDLPKADESIPLGAVWNNTEALIFDKNDQPVQPGEPGELLIRSATRMKGYWGKPDLTAKGFYKIKRIPGCEEIFYRTGDLVRIREDGNLMFLGRKDRQIKTRGYRVELDEVEAHLTAHESVEEAAVFAVRHEDELHIQAAAILKKETNETTLQQYLATLLPHYAIPQKIIFTHEIPRTAAGKINHKLLAGGLVAKDESQI